MVTYLTDTDIDTQLQSSIAALGNITVTLPRTCVCQDAAAERRFEIHIASKGILITEIE